ncbi:MAG: nucleotide exchange factor GrpE [Salaquimonas sp.]
MADNTEHHETDEPVEKKVATDHEEALGEHSEDDAEMELAAAAAKGGFSNPVEFLSAELDRLENEKLELKDNFMRAHADMENLRRRTQRDVADARQFSIAGFAREMLSVADNLNRTLEAIPEEARSSGDKGFETLIEGVELTQRTMMQALEKQGVKKLNPLNEKFDPNLHQAMFEIPNPDVANNTVLQVVQEGFVIGDRCLRPAMVGVSKGGPKSAPAPEASVEEASEDSASE